MAKVVYFGKHISDKIRDANRVFSEILISPFIVRNERKIRHQTYDEFVDIKKRVIIGFDIDKQGDFVTKDFYDKDIKDVCVNKYILDKSINYVK